MAGWGFSFAWNAFTGPLASFHYGERAFLSFAICRRRFFEAIPKSAQMTPLGYFRPKG
jgi:hypothetical protein